MILSHRRDTKYHPDLILSITQPKTFLLSNIRGLLGQGGNSKTGFLFDQAVSHQASIVTETWLKPEVKDSELLVNFPGYSLFRCDRQKRRGGGVCAFICDDISAECIGTYDNGVCELLVLKIHSLNTIVALLYRPPDTRLSEFSPVLSELEKILSDMPSPAPTICMHMPDCFAYPHLAASLG